MKEWELMLKMIKAGFVLNAGIVFMFLQIITGIAEGIYIGCECTECKTITKIHHSKEAAIVAFKEGLVHKNEQSEHIWA